MLILLFILKILLFILLFIIGLIMLLLLIPVSYSGQVDTYGGFKAEVAVGWAWRLLGIKAEMEGEAYNMNLLLFNRRIYRIKGNKAEKQEAASEEKEKKEETREKKKGREFGIRDILDKALITEIKEYFKRMLGILKPKYIHLYGTYGFDDPSVTGMISGVAGIIKGMFPHARVSLSPDFTQEILELDFRAEGSVVIGGLAFQTLRTALRKPVRRIWFRRKKR